MKSRIKKRAKTPLRQVSWNQRFPNRFGPVQKLQSHLVLTTADKKLVDIAREKIKELEKQQDIVFTELASQLQTVKEPENTILWDHVYNGTDWIVEYQD